MKTFVGLSILSLASGQQYRSNVSLAPPMKQCPTDFQLQDDGTCTAVRTSDFEITCPAGTTYDEGQCTHLEIVGAEFICAPDETLVMPGDSYHNAIHSPTCVKVESLDPAKKCRAGDVYDDEKGLCVTETSTTPLERCPENMMMHNKKCISVITAKPTRRCKDNYIARDNVCVLIEKTETQINCPTGTTFANGKCIDIDAHVEPHMGCRSGGKFKDGVCQISINVEKDTICPKDYFPSQTNPDGTILQCVKHMPIDPVLECLSGFELIDGACVKRMKPEFKCQPPMTKIDNGDMRYCIREFVKNPELACPQNSELNESGECVSFAEFQNDEVLKCSSGYTLFNGLCHQIIVEENVVSCPSNGLLLDNAECITETFDAGVLLCPVNTSLDESGPAPVCRNVQSADVTHICPGNQTFDTVRSKCVSKNSYTPTYTCADGFVYREVPNDSQTSSFGLNGVPIIQKRGECFRVHKEQPQYHCPLGQLNADTGTCNRSTVVDPMRRCPSGYTRKGDDICEKTYVESPTMVCPEGSVLKDGVCQTRSAVALSQPDDFQIKLFQQARQAAMSTLPRRDMEDAHHNPQNINQYMAMSNQPQSMHHQTIQTPYMGHPMTGGQPMGMGVHHLYQQQQQQNYNQQQYPHQQMNLNQMMMGQSANNSATNTNQSSPNVSGPSVLLNSGFLAPLKGQGIESDADRRRFRKKDGRRDD